MKRTPVYSRRADKTKQSIALVDLTKKCACWVTLIFQYSVCIHKKNNKSAGTSILKLQ